MGDPIQELGIDEAGYAPRLGPLVVTAVSVVRPAETDLYEGLDGVVSRSARSRRTAEGMRMLHVGDSKKVYTRSRGLADLERGVLAFAARALGRRPATDLDLARALTGEMMDVDGLPWYEGPAEPLPVEAEADDLERATACLASALDGARSDGPSIRSRLVTARDLNGGVSDERNKADFLCSLVAGLLAEMGRDEGVTKATVDRLGGRKDYRPLLQNAWPDAEVATVAAEVERSSYRVAGSTGARRDVTFACRAEDSSLPVALASMVSKYLRELFMRRLNRWFASHVPGIAPTAGYPVDAARFLKDCEAFRGILPVVDENLIRSR